MEKNKDENNHQRVLDVISAFMDGRSNDFHNAMEEIETHLGHEGLDRVNQLLALFPKQYIDHVDAVYQLLITIHAIHRFANQTDKKVEGLYSEEILSEIMRVKVEDHWK